MTGVGPHQQPCRCNPRSPWLTKETVLLAFEWRPEGTSPSLEEVAANTLPKRPENTPEEHLEYVWALTEAWREEDEEEWRSNEAN